MQGFERAVGDGFEDGEQVGFKQGEEVEGFGVAETGVVLDQADAAARGHEAAVQNAAIGLAGFFPQCGYGLLVDGLGLGDVFAGKKREQAVGAGVGAHAAGVGAAVAIEGALVVLDGRHVAERRAVREAEERKLFAFELFFDDEGVSGGEEFAAEGEGVVERVEVVAEDFDALAAGEAVVLDDVMVAEAAERGFGLLEGGFGEAVGGSGVNALVDRVAGDVVFGEEVAGEAFGAFDAGEGFCGAYGGDACGPEGIGYAGREGGFGADHGEGRVLLDGKGGDGGWVGERADLVAAGEASQSFDAGVVGVGEAEQVGALRGAREGRGDRVFPRAGADDQDGLRRSRHS